MQDICYDIPMGFEEEVCDTVSQTSISYESPTEENLVPKNQNFLGLDISKNGTGVTVYLEGVKKQWVIASKYCENHPHRETLLRRSLKSQLQEILEGISFEAIIIEDVYQGENPDTARKLYALNTAIDELILDGFVSCNDFQRVNNKAWKKWLSAVDSMGTAKGYNDKLKVQMYMEMLGVRADTDANFQDKLDSNGLILGYLLHKSLEGKRTKVKKVSFSDLRFAYLLDTDELNYDFRETTGMKRIFVDETRWTKEKVVQNISDYPYAVIITENPVSLSMFMQKATNCNSVITDGGYFAFWVVPTKLKKYLKEE